MRDIDQIIAWGFTTGRLRLAPSGMTTLHYFHAPGCPMEAGYLLPCDCRAVIATRHEGHVFAIIDKRGD